MSDFAVGVHFEDFKSAEEAVVAFCRQNYHPVRHDSKETFRAANKKLSAKNRVLDMPEDAVFACRWVCKHYGKESASSVRRRLNKRTNQAVMPSGCTMAIYVRFDRLTRKYVVKTLQTEHNHSNTADDYETYATTRRPAGEIRERAELLVSQGANLSLVKQYLNKNGSNVTSKDLYNMRQKMSFRGSATDDLLDDLKASDIRYDVCANVNDCIESVCWPTVSQLSILKPNSEVLMRDGTYKSVADAEMASEASPSTSTVVDSEASTTTNTCHQLPTVESQMRLQSNGSETVNYDAGSENELKPGWEVSACEDDGPALKKPKLEVASSTSTEGESGSMTEPKREIETSCGNENVIESVTNERLWGGIDEHSGGAAKKRRLDRECIRNTEEESSERSDRRRNKSTSAAVLLGLVKSRVHKLAAERLEANSVSSDATTSSSSQTSASSLSAKASPKVNTPPVVRTPKLSQTGT